MLFFLRIIVTVFLLALSKNKGLPRRYLFSPSMRVLRRPRVLCTFMRQQCAVSRPVPVTILIPDPPFPWVDTLSGVPHQPDRSVSHPDRPVDHPEPVLGSVNGMTSTLMSAAPILPLLRASYSPWSCPGLLAIILMLTTPNRNDLSMASGCLSTSTTAENPHETCFNCRRAWSFEGSRPLLVIRGSGSVQGVVGCMLILWPIEPDWAPCFSAI